MKILMLVCTVCNYFRLFVANFVFL